MLKDLVEREAATAVKEVGLGLGKVCVVDGVGIGRRGVLAGVVVLKRRVLMVGFLIGRENKLLLGFLKGNENFCIPSTMHFPNKLFRC